MQATRPSASVDALKDAWNYAQCADCGEYRELRGNDVPWPRDKAFRCSEVSYCRRRCGEESRKRARSDEVLDEMRLRVDKDREKALQKAEKHGGAICVPSATDPSKMVIKLFHVDPRSKMTEAHQARLLKELTDFEISIGMVPSPTQTIEWCVVCGKPSRLRKGHHAWPENTPFLCVSAGGDDCRPSFGRTSVTSYMQCRTIGCNKHVAVPKEKDPWPACTPFYCCDARSKCEVQFCSEWC